MNHSKSTVTDAKRNRIYSLTLFLLFFVLAVLKFSTHYTSMVFADGDPAWHLATGDYIRAHGAIPKHDPWSFTAGEQIWYSTSWAYDVAISFIAEHGGLESVMLLAIILSAITLSMVMHIGLRMGAGFFALALAVPLAILSLQGSLNIRPQIVSVFMAVLYYLLLSGFRETGKSKAIIALPFLSIAWVNLHSGFLTMIPLLGAFGLEMLANKKWAMFAKLIAISVLCMFATLLNPYGLGIYKSALLILQSPLANGFIHEWNPPTLTTFPLVFLYLAFIVALPGFVSKRYLANTLLAFFWTLMALQSARYDVMQSMFITPPLALALDHLIKRYRENGYVSVSKKYTDTFSRSGMLTIIAIITICMVGVLAIPQIRNFIWSSSLADKAKVPVEEIAFLKKHYPQSKVFNHFNYGGFLIFFGHGELKPMIDGRVEIAYPVQAILDYQKLEAFEDGWEEILDKYGIEVALLPNNYNYRDALMRYKGWEKAFVGNAATVYVK